MTVRVQQEAFATGAEIDAFSVNQLGAGAIVTFSGVVRGDGGITRLSIEHYPGMTERALQSIQDEAVQRWSLTGALVIHRYGVLHVGETIMMVATAAPHRADAFAAAEFLMDFLKSRAPFWKKEVRPDGETWVEAKEADEAALNRW